MKKTIFPFTAVVGQNDFKLTLLLNIIDPSIGGVLAIGDKGTGKTTLIRSLSALIEAHQNFPFVNLPIGVSQDRVLGHINLEKLINDKQEHVVPGLLAKANKGCLYIDEINLLNDYLMDTLLDAAASGGYYLEREGLSKYLDSKFCLVGSMNPEEGDLRPQLKDRFGLSVTVTTNKIAKERLQIIKNRLAFDDDPQRFVTNYIKKEQAVYKKINEAKLLLNQIQVQDEIYEAVTSLVLKHQVEGHRADILLIKTARAYAAYLGEKTVTINHLEVIKDFVLQHRSNIKKPSEQSPESNIPEQKENHKKEDFTGNSQLFESVLPNINIKQSEDFNVKVSKKGKKIVGQGGSKLDTLNDTSNATIDVKKTISKYVTTDSFELQYKQQHQQSQKHLIFLLDSSGSMLKDKVVAYAKGVVQEIVEKENRNHPLFSLISISNGNAAVLAKGEKDIQKFTKELNAIETGGKTNVVPAFKIIKDIIKPGAQHNNELIMVTDGKFTSDKPDPFNEAVLSFKMYCKSITKKMVIDAERGVVKLALAQKFAAKINANYETLVY